MRLDFCRQAKWGKSHARAIKQFKLATEKANPVAV
jgi:hypothetical protein